MSRSNEPLWWGPFSAGMFIDALLMPALIVVTGLLLPLGLVSPNFPAFLNHWFTRLVLFVTASLTFFHAAHRMRFALADLGLKAGRQALAFLLYGAAIVGTVIAALVAAGVL